MLPAMFMMPSPRSLLSSGNLHAVSMMSAFDVRRRATFRAFQSVGSSHVTTRDISADAGSGGGYSNSRGTTAGRSAPRRGGSSGVRDDRASRGGISQERMRTDPSAGRGIARRQADDEDGDGDFEVDAPAAASKGAGATSGSGGGGGFQPRANRASSSNDFDIDKLLSNTDTVAALRRNLLGQLSAQHDRATTTSAVDAADSPSTSPASAKPAPGRELQRSLAMRRGGDSPASASSTGGGSRTRDSGSNGASSRTAERSSPASSYNRSSGGSSSVGGRGLSSSDRVAADRGAGAGARRDGPSSARSEGASRLSSAANPATITQRARDEGYAPKVYPTLGPFPYPCVVLRDGKEWLFRDGCPMVYSGAVTRTIADKKVAAGDAVMVIDAWGNEIAWGVYNPVSMFQVRIMQTRGEFEADRSCLLDMPALIRSRVAQALALRQALGLPNASTNVYRLINSEGDRMSGVIADVLGDAVVVQSLAAWTERYREELSAAITAATGLQRIVWRPSEKILLEEGVQPATAAAAAVQATKSLTKDADAADEHGGASADGSSGDDVASVVAEDAVADVADGAGADTSAAADDEDAAAGGDGAGVAVSNHRPMVVLENGLKLYASPMGQKTGFYADQRDSRAFIGSVSRGRDVLDLCCYSGGFALAAAVGGARSVVGVDSSAQAVDLANKSAALNDLPKDCEISFVQAEIGDWMSVAVDEVRGQRDEARQGRSAAAKKAARAAKTEEAAAANGSEAVADEDSEAAAAARNGDAAVAPTAAVPVAAAVVAGGSSRQYDVVVLDPPKLAPSSKWLMKAKIKYQKLNEQALLLVRPGGLLMTCSCSGAMTQNGELQAVVLDAARHVGRQVSLVRTASAGADHPLHPAYPEGRYLTNLTYLVL